MSMTSNGLFNAMNRFGFTTEQLLAYSPDYKDRSKVACYVPTRNDVFRLPISQLEPILTTWFTHAPPAIAPSTEQKEAVLALLRIRLDRRAITEAIARLETLAGTRQAE